MNLNKLKKADWIWLYNHRCKKHNRRYTEHPACFVEDYPDVNNPAGIREKIGFLDIETSGLNADFSIMLTWSIKIEDKVFFDFLKKEDFNTNDKFRVDKRIVASVVEKLGELDRVVTFYGRKFDLKYIRTRALIDGIDFPSFGQIANDDCYYWAKNKLKLHSNRLDSVMTTLFGHSDKTRMDGNIWIPASMGDEKAIEQILEHNIIDVEELQKVWLKLGDFVGKRSTSI